MPTLGYAVTKRVFDLSAATIGLVVLSPLLAAIAVLVRTTSAGPVFYRGVRTGYRGRPFRMFKYRTMVVGAEAGGTTTRLGDPRLTRVGRVLRHWKFDELPQLFNIITGDMSFVGPRPEVDEHTNAYSDEERRILDVRPGITDLASIELVNLDEQLGVDDPHGEYVRRVRAIKNRLRLEYVDRRSFWLDLNILRRTLVAVVRKGAPSSH